MIKEIDGIKFKSLEQHVCKKCGCFTDGSYEHLTTNNAIKATCAECGAFIKFLPHYEEVDIEPPTGPQINYVKKYKREGMLPLSKSRATELIAVLEKVKKDYELRRDQKSI